MILKNTTIEIPEDFLKEEERCGYLVTNKMKKVWVVEMDMLAQIQRVCKKYNLTYFADSGTLLGAIRHKGFIPWDDDIDLVMPRKDYDKLIEVADKEFAHPLFMQTCYSDPYYVREHAQLRNSETTGYLEGEETEKFNRGLFIDIFPIDNLPDNKTLLKIYIKRINFKWKLICERKRGKTSDRKFIGLFANTIMSTYFKIFGFAHCFRKYEKYCAKYKNKRTKLVSDIQYAKGREKNIWQRDWYISGQEVPFEFMTINIPNGYDGRLRREYGEYMVMSKAPSVHGGTILDPDVSYLEYKS